MGTDKAMCKIRGLLIRADGYYFNARVPQDCTEQVGKKLIREKLNASTCAEAKAEVSRKWVEVEQRFAQIRAGGYIPTSADIEQYCAAWIQTQLEEDEEIRTEGLDEGGYRIIQESLDISNAGSRAELARGDTRTTEAEMEDFLDWKFNVKLAPNSEAYRKTAYAFLKASVKATEMLLARHRGEIVDTPAAAPQTTTAEKPAAPLLSKVIEYFLDNYADKTRPMYRKHRAVLPVFLAIVGDKPVNQFKQMDLEDFARLICKLPPRAGYVARKQGVTIRQLADMEHGQTIAPKTFEDVFIASVRPFLAASRRSFGEAGFPLHLTTAGIVYQGLVKAGEFKQRALTAEEMQRLMDALAPLAKDEPHKFWLPLVALYTAARVREICQVNPQTDIASTDEGIPYFAFTDEGDTDERAQRSIKNATSRRALPIHPDLIAHGFMEYVEAIRASGAKLLFPQWAPQRGNASSGASDWFTVFLRTIKLHDDTPGKQVRGFHAFRSTFIARALNLRVQDTEYLTGHAGNTSAVVRGYQGELGVKQKLEILRQVTFEFLIWPDVVAL